MPAMGRWLPSPAGPKVSLEDHPTRRNGDVVLSLYLEKNAFGECGYRSFNLGPHGSLTASDLPQGCYLAGAFVQDPKQPYKAFGRRLCLAATRGSVTIGTKAARDYHRRTRWINPGAAVAYPGLVFSSLLPDPAGALLSVARIGVA